MEIRINRKFIILALAVASVIAGGVFVFPRFFQTAQAQDLAGPTAEKFARAYFAADYRTQSAWLEGVRATMSEDGYAVFEAQYLPVMWPLVTPPDSKPPSDSSPNTASTSRRTVAARLVRPCAVTVSYTHLTLPTNREV